MLPYAHKKLAIFIAQKFFLSEDLKKALIKGSLAPDKKPKSFLRKIFYQRKAHHFGREKDIENYIWRARKEFLKNNMEKSCYLIGYALHFIADAPIYSPALYPVYRHGRGAGLKTWHAKRRARKLHFDFEKEISKISFEENLPLLLLDSPFEISSTIKDFLYKDRFYSPQWTLNRIYQTSFALVELTWRDPKILNQKEKEILEKIPKSKIKYLFIIGGAVFFLGWLLKEFSLFFLISMPLIGGYLFSNTLNPWRIESWYRKKITILGLSKE